MRREVGWGRGLASAGFVAAVLALAGFGVAQVAGRQWRVQPTFAVAVRVELDAARLLAALWIDHAADEAGARVDAPRVLFVFDALLPFAAAVAFGLQLLALGVVRQARGPCRERHPVVGGDHVVVELRQLGRRLR